MQEMWLLIAIAIVLMTAFVYAAMKRSSQLSREEEKREATRMKKTIVSEIGAPAALGQLAEEAAELAQAALKIQRILMGKNPTPVSLEKARADLAEEATDVRVCLDVLSDAGYTVFDPDGYWKKVIRWEERIGEVSEEP